MADDGIERFLAVLREHRRISEPMSRLDVLAEGLIFPVLGWGGTLLLAAGIVRQLRLW